MRTIGSIFIAGLLYIPILLVCACFTGGVWDYFCVNWLWLMLVGGLVVRFTINRQPPARLGIKSLIDEGLICLDLEKNPEGSEFPYKVLWFANDKHIREEVGFAPRRIAKDGACLCYKDDPEHTSVKITRAMLPERVRHREGLD